MPLTTEAPTLDRLFARAVEIAPEIAIVNGLAEHGEYVAIQIAADQARSG